ncbi:MAG: cell envelope integrity protein TolA [Burkholderiales bacterium]|nr:cell envelope integrity protein TolA [Burkholderiales bacterium]
MNASTLRPPPAGRGQGIGAFLLALLMHLMLVAMFLLGLRWQTHPPVAVQAELWTPPAPRETPAPAPPAPVVPETANPPPRPVDTEPAADITLQTLRKERERQAREAEAARLAEAKQQADAQARRQAQARAAAEAKALQARQAAEALDAKKALEARKLLEARKAREAAEARQQEQARLDEQAQERSRADHVKRLLAQAGGERTPRQGAAVGAEAGGASGAALGTWGAKVASHIRSNTVFQIPPDLRGNPKAEFTVSILPDGSIVNLKLTRSSGVPAWDQAAERAIRRSDPLPRPPAGAPRDVSIVQGPRDE